MLSAMHYPEDSALPLQPQCTFCTPSFDQVIPQRGAAGTIGKNGNGKRKKEVPKGEQKLSLSPSTDITWSKGTTRWDS